MSKIGSGSGKKSVQTQRIDGGNDNTADSQMRNRTGVTSQVAKSVAN